jgi:hypothetical protein
MESVRWGVHLMECAGSDKQARGLHKMKQSVKFNIDFCPEFRGGNLMALKSLFSL